MTPIVRAATAAHCLALLTAGCSGLEGPAGSAAPSTGTLAGTVTFAAVAGTVPLAGATVAFDPPAAAATTAGDGTWSAELPLGVYTVTWSRADFTPQTATLSVIAGRTTTRDVELVPVAPVIVSAGPDAVAAPVGSATLTGSVTAIDQSSTTGWSWLQVGGPPATLVGADGPSLRVDLPDLETYKAALVTALAPPDRGGLVAIQTAALQEVARLTFLLTVTTTSGSYTDEAVVTVDLGLQPTTGLRNVPVGVPVMARAPAGVLPDWSLTTPGGAAAIDSATTPYPIFVPDAAGTYTLTDATSGTSIAITAGGWAGAVTGLDESGRPVAGNCLVGGCHSPGGPIHDYFLRWAGSGHAEIFQQSVDAPGTAWTVAACGRCHTVGFDGVTSNGGFDQGAAEDGWTGPAGGGPGSFDAMFLAAPNAAAAAGVQCESCHGPNDGPAHFGPPDSRYSLASEVCGNCHGEPARYGKYQQWRTSAHARYDTALAYGAADLYGSSAGHCGRCHTAQGFVAWLRQGDLTARIQGAAGNAVVSELIAMGLTSERVEPITCAACHDPHDPGTTAGRPNDARVRLDGSTPALPGGFVAEGVGRGAICIACHGTYAGLHEDPAIPWSFAGPHASVEADVLLGRNAFFVQPGRRSPHSYLADTCAGCHLGATPPPPELSYAGKGTNHRFRATASACEACHVGMDAANLATATAAMVSGIGDRIGTRAVKALQDADVVVWVRACDPATGLCSAPGSTDATISFHPKGLVSAVPALLHGSLALELHLRVPIPIQWVDGSTTSTDTLVASLSTIRLGTGGTTGPLAWAPDAPLAKALWNHSLLANDGSGGAHNPGFVLDVYQGTLAALP